MANATATQLQQLYVGYFARPGDPAGLDYWVAEGTTTKEFADSMWSQNEFQNDYGDLSVRDQINQLYINLFDREGDPGGLDYWVSKINSGEMQLASIANDLIYAATYGDAEGSVADLDCLQNRTAAAQAYTAEIRSNAICYIWYMPDSVVPWVPGNLDEGKSYLKAIGCGGVYKYIGYDDIIAEYIIYHCSPSIDPIIVNTTSNQDSFDECGCNKQLETLSIEDGLFPSLGNSYVDNSLVYDSPYGLSPSNNTVIDLIVSVDNGLF